MYIVILSKIDKYRQISIKLLKSGYVVIKTTFNRKLYYNILTTNLHMPYNNLRLMVTPVKK